MQVVPTKVQTRERQELTPFMTLPDQEQTNASNALAWTQGLKNVQREKRVCRGRSHGWQP